MVKERVSLEDFPLYSRDGSNKLTEEQVGGGLGVECFKMEHGGKTLMS